MEFIGIIFILIIGIATYAITPKFRGLLLWFAIAIIVAPIVFGIGAFGLGLVLMSPYLFALIAAIAIVVGVGILLGLLTRYCCIRCSRHP